MDTDRFVSLHTHSDLSILDGGSKIETYFARAAELKQPALAITDHGSLSGLYRGWKAARNHGIKFIAGAEFYIAPSYRGDRTPVEGFGGGGKYAHLTVLARDGAGVRNLYRLQARGYAEGLYGKPRIDFDILEEHREGLIVLSGCAGGHISTYLRAGDLDAALQLGNRLRSSFGDSFFIEVMSHGIKEDDLDEEWLNGALIDLSEHLGGVPLVATNDAHYCHPGEADVHDALLCVQTQAQLTDTNRFKFSGSGYHLKSRSEMEALPLPVESLDNTIRIADMVESYDEIFEHRLRMPKFQVPVVW